MFEGFCRIRDLIESYEKHLKSYFAKAIMVDGLCNSSIVILRIILSSNTLGSGIVSVFHC